MSSPEIGNILNTIGKHIANILEKKPRDVFVYLCAGDQWMEGAIFDNVENEVIYYRPDKEMVQTVMQLWEATATNKKWEMLHYDIKDGKFSVEYFYTDQLDPDEGSYERRERALEQRFGDKPIIYPPPDPGLWDLTEDRIS
jgi:hypothetical protein